MAQPSAADRRLEASTAAIAEARLILRQEARRLLAERLAARPVDEQETA